MMDTFFISHGSPSLLIDDSRQVRHFLKSWKDSVLKERPKSILVISAHWDTFEPSVNVISGINDTIYDFNGFPKPLYEIKYSAPGAPLLAKRVKELLNASGFERVHEDEKRGLDHGTWVPLLLMYPEADIPVCQLSVQTHRDGTYHYKMGKALAPLKEEGVLIIGSGAATHNLRVAPVEGHIAPWALEFDDWLKDALFDGRYEDVNHYDRKAPHAKMAHPTPEHFNPLHVAMGAAGENSQPELVHHSWELGTFSYASYRFKNAFK